MDVSGIRSRISEHLDTVQRVSDLAEDIHRIGEQLLATIRSGHRIYICGNGGSASDAQHFAAELTGRFAAERKGYPAVALTTDTSALTAIGNDYGFDRVFARQVEALGEPGDQLIGISTSGNSRNVLEAVDAAGSAGMSTIGLLGKDGGQLRDAVDEALVVPSTVTARIQEAHILILHLLCEAFEP